VQAQLQQIEPVFQAVAFCIQYPGDAPAVLPAGFKDRQEWEETFQVMQARLFLADTALFDFWSFVWGLGDFPSGEAKNGKCRLARNKRHTRDAFFKSAYHG